MTPNNPGEFSTSIAQELVDNLGDSRIDKAVIGYEPGPTDDYDGRTYIYGIDVDPDTYVVYIDFYKHSDIAYEGPEKMFETEVKRRKDEHEYISDRGQISVVYDPSGSTKDIASCFDDDDEWEYEEVEN